MPTQDPQTLREKVQGFRDKARVTLRMERIADLLQEYFHAEQAFNSRTKDADAHAKSLETLKYEASKLDEKHPEYKEKLEKAEANITRAEKNTEDYAKSIEQTQEIMANIDTQIAEVEQGKFLVSISAIESLTKKMIEKNMYTS